MTFSARRRLRAAWPGIRHGRSCCRRVPPRSRHLAGAARQLAALGRVAPVQMTFRADFPAAAIEGMAAVEYTGKAAEETAALLAYVNELLGGRDAAPEG